MTLETVVRSRRALAASSLALLPAACGVHVADAQSLPPEQVVTAPVPAPPVVAPEPPVKAPTPAPTAPSPEEPRYSLEDLRRLAGAEAWRELLVHADDVPPAQRDDPWKSLVVTAATKDILAEEKSTGDPEELALAVQGFFRRYPFLGESRDVLALRGPLMVHAADTCTATVNAHYFDRCLWFATAFPGDAVHAQAAGDDAIRHGHRALALKLFRVAAELDSHTLCRHAAALAIVAEVRSGRSEAGSVADGEAIHAQCETARRAH